ncbi:MAG: hypothetical protein LBK95_20620 [Bifidobacteriaceae bacterium]|jgi:hypothetical protein|nr:hypothetical protein [Bifidobacteriaceae bacterium]
MPDHSQGFGFDVQFAAEDEVEPFATEAEATDFVNRMSLRMLDETRSTGRRRITPQNRPTGLAEFQAAVAAGMKERGAEESLLDSLLDERATDPSAAA